MIHSVRTILSKTMVKIENRTIIKITILVIFKILPNHFKIMKIIWIEFLVNTKFKFPVMSTKIEILINMKNLSKIIVMTKLVIKIWDMMKITGEMMIIINLEIKIAMISMLITSLDILIIKKGINLLKEINIATIMAKSIIKVIILYICLFLITNQALILVIISHKASSMLIFVMINVRACLIDSKGFL